MQGVRQERLGKRHAEASGVRQRPGKCRAKISQASGEWIAEPPVQLSGDAASSSWAP